MFRIRVISLKGMVFGCFKIVFKRVLSLLWLYLLLGFFKLLLSSLKFVIGLSFFCVSIVLDDAMLNKDTTDDAGGTNGCWKCCSSILDKLVTDNSGWLHGVLHLICFWNAVSGFENLLLWDPKHKKWEKSIVSLCFDSFVLKIWLWKITQKLRILWKLNHQHKSAWDNVTCTKTHMDASYLS